ncbi:transglycosylase domain-containing protein [Sphingosinithalassobacter sp. LHW66-3]|uniref:transglycosylase domain-containing protein n=1 Tax=Sphingosinithalassobacter sp. LHW66-3 TaxID=3424718 RepID=UPI003D6ADC65
MSDSDPFDWTRVRHDGSGDPLELTGGLPPGRSAKVPLRPAPPGPPSPPGPSVAAGPFEPAPGSYTTNLPVVYRPSPWRWVVRGVAALIVLMIVAIGWLTLTAPLSKSLQPPAPPSITLLSSDGTPIARRGANIGAPVDAAELPEHVRNAFIAIEDRRFYGHWGIDPRGIARAMLANLSEGGVRQGGSTITQQLAKNAFLDLDRTMGRKFQEMLIAFWLEAWLSKNDILSRYLSNVYFGDNAYGLTAAARHYFSKTPKELSVGEAAMLAGLVQAPSRLAPTGNLSGARERQQLVVGAMVDAGLLDPQEAEEVRPARLDTHRVRALPSGTYFADWVLPQARDRAGEIASEQTVQTTLDARLQRAADRAVANAGLRKAQAALVAMRPDGTVVAMVGGRNYRESPFNRATQARRQPGSTFKLFVYLAALRSGMTPNTLVRDEPVTLGDWSPENSDGRYFGQIPLWQAFARSSNVAAARLIRQVGPQAVIRAARDLGITTRIPADASIALGTSNVSLIELTAAYAAIAAGEAPVRVRGLPEDQDRTRWLSGSGASPLSRRELEGMRTLLAASIREGTSRPAGLSIDAFGKTGTTQDNRDAWFVGYAGDLVVGVWVGNDDNTPNAGLSSAIPARIWRDFMTTALGVSARRAAPPPQVEEAAVEETEPGFSIEFDEAPFGLEGEFRGRGFSLEVGPDGGITVAEPGAPVEDRKESPDRLEILPPERRGIAPPPQRQPLPRGDGEPLYQPE